MAARSCRVTIQDLEGVAHTVEVTAESLYEAVAQGLAALRRSDWVHLPERKIVLFGMKTPSYSCRRSEGIAGYVLKVRRRPICLRLGQVQLQRASREG